MPSSSKISFGKTAGLSAFKSAKGARMPSTGMKYSTYRLNPGSQLNRSIHLPRFKVKKFADGGHIDSRIEGTPPKRSKSAKEENIDYLNNRDQSPDREERISERDLEEIQQNLEDARSFLSTNTPRFAAGGQMNIPMTGYAKNMQQVSPPPGKPPMGAPQMSPGLQAPPMAGHPGLPPSAHNQVQGAAQVLAALQAQRGRPMPAQPGPGMPRAGVQPVMLGKAGGFAGGGKVGMTASALRAISDALGHLANSDSASAVDTLKKVPELADSAKSVRTDPKGTAKRLSKTLEAQADWEKTPTFAKGGQVREKMEALMDSSTFALSRKQRDQAKAIRRALVGDNGAKDPANRLPFENEDGTERDSALFAEGGQVTRCRHCGGPV